MYTSSCLVLLLILNRYIQCVYKEDVSIYFHMTILQEADVDDDDVDDDADEKVNISHCYKQPLFVMINTN